MDIISEYADKDAVQATLSGSPELERLAFEFCKAFNCKVADSVGFNSHGRHGVRVLIGNGISAGVLYVDPNCAKNKEGERVMTYMYKSPHIQKDRCSRYAGRDTRDSVKISSLIAAVRKCGEAPDMSNILKQYKQGIRYAYGSVGSNMPSVSFSVAHEHVMDMAKHFLGIVDEKPAVTVDAVRYEYEKHLQRLAQAEAVKQNSNRYADGCYTVGYITTDAEKPYYIVTETHIDDPRDPTIKFQGEVKRYTTLSECPELAAQVSIIRAWAEGQPDVGENEFGLPRRDRYYPDIDVSTGYSTSTELWFVLPKKAP